MRPKGAKTKQIIHRHAKRRAKERLGMELTAQELEGLVKTIQAQQAVLIDKQSNNVSRFLVSLRGQPVVAVYDKQRKGIRTLLKPEYVAVREE